LSGPSSIGVLDLCLICVAKSNTIMSHGAIDPGAESRAGEGGAGVARAGDQHVEAAVALSRDFDLSRRQAYRYLEEAQAVASPPVVAEASVTITLKIPSNIVRELRAYSAISGLTMSEIVRRAISAFLSAARGHG
jgi:hypothetical protein